ncbi:MAG: DUF4147 domain-containing protein [Candidatus Cloacimonetes bacterium]|nr:DUF4147 domain-containing protein [Candidatus Cloacimonadota bacterium]
MKEFLTDIMNKSLEAARADKLLIPHLCNIKTDKQIKLIGIGKAANEMVKACYDFFNEQIAESLIICPDYSTDYHLPNCQRLVSAHPLPDERSLQAGKNLVDCLKDKKDIFTLFLISGGGSSLVELLPDGLSLDMFRFLNDQLLKAEVSINDINCIRKHISLIKGGRLLETIDPDNAFCFILSDIFTGEHHNVASGLTFSDDSSLTDAQDILKQYLPEEYSIYEEWLTETPKHVKNVPYHCIGDNEKLLQIIKKQFNEQNIPCEISPYRLADYANMSGLNIGCMLYKFFKKREKPFALLFGGECLVKVKGEGRGGRCSELMLALSIELQFMPCISALCFTSDGHDGNAPSSGAFADHTSYQRLISQHNGIFPEIYLKRNDTFSAFTIIGDSLSEQNTGTNMNDVLIVLFS